MHTCAFVHRHKLTQLLFLADPPHHPACREERKDQLLNCWWLLGMTEAVLYPHSFLPHEQWLSVSSHLPLSSLFSVPPLPHNSSHFSAFCLGDKSFGVSTFWTHVGTRAKVVSGWKVLLALGALSLMQRQLLMWLQLTSLLKWCQRLLLRLLLPSGFPAFTKIDRILLGHGA